jgi:hypothetical protein
VAFSLMTAAFGLLIAAVGKTPEATRGRSILVTLIIVMLGGAWVPAFIFPQWLHKDNDVGADSLGDGRSGRNDLARLEFFGCNLAGYGAACVCARVRSARRDAIPLGSGELTYTEAHRLYRGPHTKVDAYFSLHPWGNYGLTIAILSTATAQKEEKT